MPSFIDSLNRSWTIEINYLSVRQLRSALNVDLMSVVEKDSDLLLRLANDEILLVDVISVLLSDQIKSRGLDESQFASGMLGAGLQSAVDALIEGIADFSRPQKGAVIRRTWQAISEAQTRASTRIVAAATSETVRAKVDEIVDSALKTLTDSSGSLPAS